MRISLKARVIVNGDNGRFGSGEFEIPVGLLGDSSLSNDEIAQRVKAAIKSRFAESPLTIAD